MEKLEKTDEIKRKLNLGEKLNASETVVLLELIASKKHIKMKLKKHKDNSYSVIDDTSLPYQMFNGNISECDSFINLKEKGYF
tara:strand:+ start:330 stop:578 length:249 start_codon:yes stop_codon:yes gene_type:complete